MVNAVILMNVQPDSVNIIAQKLSGMEGVSTVYSVGGRFDLVVLIQARDNEHLAKIVTENMLKVQGIRGTETLFAYRVFPQDAA